MDPFADCSTCSCICLTSGFSSLLLGPTSSCLSCSDRPPHVTSYILFSTCQYFRTLTCLGATFCSVFIQNKVCSRPVWLLLLQPWWERIETFLMLWRSFLLFPLQWSHTLLLRFVQAALLNINIYTVGGVRRCCCSDSRLSGWLADINRPVEEAESRRNDCLVDINTTFFVSSLPCFCLLLKTRVWLPLSYNESICCMGIPPRPWRRSMGVEGGKKGVLMV